eukprot:482312-Amphidinium_carterae.3
MEIIHNSESGQEKSVEAIDLRNIQDVCVKEDVQFRDINYPNQPTEDDGEELEDYNELSLAARKKRDQISSMPLTLNFVMNSWFIQLSKGQSHTP